MIITAQFTAVIIPISVSARVHMTGAVITDPRTHEPTESTEYMTRGVFLLEKKPTATVP